MSQVYSHISERLLQFCVASLSDVIAHRLTPAAWKRGEPHRQGCLPEVPDSFRPLWVR